MRLTFPVLCVLAAACQRTVNTALEPMVTDRPDFTESSDAVQVGHAQVESGTTFTRSGDRKSHSLGEMLVRVGVVPRTELRVGFNSYAIDLTDGARASGFEDASLGVKLHLANGGGTGSWRPALALIAATSLPTGASVFGSEKLQPEWKLTQAWQLSDRIGFASNVNYAMVRDVAVTSGEWAASGSLGVSLTDRIGSYIEYFGFYPNAEYSEKTHYLNSGLTFGLGANAQLDARGGIGLRNVRGPDYFVGVGLARRW